MDYLKKIIAVLMVGVLFFPFETRQIEAAPAIQSKTVEFFIGQDLAIEVDNQINFPFFIDIPESSIGIKSAIIEISGISYNDSGNQVINIDLKKDPDPQGSGADYTLGGNSKARPFLLKYDASQVVSSVDFPGIKNYTLFLKGTSEIGSGIFSVFSSKLVLTYNYSSSGANFLKTTEFFIGQEQGSVSSGLEVRKDFTVAISENDPIIQSVFVEASGTAKGSGVGAINLSVADFGQSAVYGAPYSLDLSPVASSARFLVRYNAIGNISSGFPGSNKYTLYFKGDGFSTNLWNAKLIVTYKYVVNTGNLPARGELISSTFDTGVVGGAAYNSLMWKGNLNGGKVWMQLATSDDIFGPWNFYGPSCVGGSADNYQLDLPGTPLEIMCADIHNNKKFFRYKVILCSDDCQNSGSNNPEVTGIVVNWSP